MFTIVFRDSSLYPKQLSLFCLLRLISASADLIGYITNLSSMDVLSTMGVSKESISKFLIGNGFHVKLRIPSPENCKQGLQVKS